MPAIEIAAHDIETAIRQGLSKLQLLRAEVTIEVLEEGSRGVLGIGSRQARVRLTPYVEVEASAAALKAASHPDPQVSGQRTTEPVEVESSQSPDNELDDLAGDDMAGVDIDDLEDTGDDEEVYEDAAIPAAIEPESVPDIAVPSIGRELAEDDANLAAQLTQGVLDRMKFRTTCAGRLVPPADDKETAHIWVAIEGEDASRLLAHQSESLEALQLVVQNMWAHKTKTSIRITLDADQYKANREHRITQMATRLAERAVSTGRSITLEPMPPAERRLVHLALRDHPQVYTESEGEGNQRRITIKLKR